MMTRTSRSSIKKAGLMDDGDVVTLNFPNALNSVERSCINCKKMKMCWFWRSVSEIERKNMQTTDKSELPIQIERLAIICEEYEEKPNV